MFYTIYSGWWFGTMEFYDFPNKVGKMSLVNFRSQLEKPGSQQVSWRNLASRFSVAKGPKLVALKDCVMYKYIYIVIHIYIDYIYRDYIYISTDYIYDVHICFCII